MQPSQPNTNTPPLPVRIQTVLTRKRAESFEELYINHLASRVSVVGVTGLAFGAAFGTMAGAPLLHTSLSTSLAWAVAATTCFGSERIFFAVIPRPFPYVKTLNGSEDILTHFCGGALGGSIIGTLYKGRPLPGIMLFTPMMLGVSLIERQFIDFKRQRIKEVLNNVEHSRK